MQQSTHSDEAIRYAEDVVSGEIVACKYVRLACQRFLDDLEREDWQYEFDPSKADKAVSFMETLHHTKGKWASKGERLKLEPWQKFVECNLFGWINKETGNRRFRESYEEIPRKNGKSLRLAGRALYMFCADHEYGAEVYSGATSEKQAWEVFRPAKQMCERNEQLANHYDIEVNAKSLVIMSSGCRFEPLIGKPGDGSSPHFAAVDEYHEHDSDHFVETMQTGMGSREQPLLSIITTAGSNLGGPCHEKRRDVIRILEGHFQDETVFAAIYTIDEGDEWDNPDSLRKANPNFGVSISEEFLLSQLEKARRSASRQNAFRTKHLNEWVGARTAWMNMLAWQRQQKELSLDDFEGFPCRLAIDLASKKDVAALCISFRVDGKFYEFQKFYAPESAAEDNEKYRNFATDGELILTPGSMTDYAFIEEDIKSLASRFDVIDVACDDWQANYLMTRLDAAGLTVINYNQNVKNMSAPMKEIEARVLDGTLFHSGNSMMTWMMGNVSARIDAKENIYPRKESDADPNCKIDGVVAMIMAHGRWLLETDDTSVYESRGVLTL